MSHMRYRDDADCRGKCGRCSLATARQAEKEGGESKEKKQLARAFGASQVARSRLLFS